MVELLLKVGADANTVLPGGETALMTASRTGKVGAVKALLAAAADVNAKESKFGQTALMWAAAEGHAETVDALVAAGAQPVDWLTDASWAFFWTVFVSIWAHMGFYTLILLAGLQSIPKELYEAARVSGVPAWAQTVYITIPMLSPYRSRMTVAETAAANFEPSR